MNNPAALIARNVVKTFNDGTGHEVKVLTGVDLTIEAGTVAAVIGASGSGKSTLLQILGGLDAADAGDVVIAGTTLKGLDEKSLGELRNRHLGFVYQFHHLLPEFTALENVAMPLFIRRMSKQEALKKAADALCALGLEHRQEHLPSQLSGGERQRTAIARAMVTSPACILADEPTGNLDHDTAMEVFDGFVASARSTGTSVLIVTHDLELASRCDVIFKLENGRVHQVESSSKDK
ncbi:MAG: ABC transporter ATP-binding protein [Sutterellaceae bacterium]|nr:ABC transporter ATP-binding protein [Sutterellaceae bacterium]